MKAKLSTQFTACLMAFAVLPLILFCLVFFPYLNHTLLTARMENLEGLAAAHAAALEDTCAALMDDAARAGEDPWLQAALLSGDEAALQTRLDSLTGSRCLSAALMSADGAWLAMTHPGYDAAEDALLPAAAALAGTPGVSQPADGSSFYLAVPVKADNTVLGALVQEVPLSLFANASFRLGETGQMLLAAQTGTLLWQSGDRFTPETFGASSLMTRFAAYQTGRQENRGTDTLTLEGSKYAAGYQMLSTLPWMVVITQAQSEVHSQEALMIVYAVLAALLLALLALLIGRAVSHSALYPIRRLNRAFSQTQANHFEPVEPAGAAEFVALAEGYNQMIARTETNINHLSDANRQLASAIAAMEIQKDRLAFSEAGQQTAQAQLNLVTGEIQADEAFRTLVELAPGQTSLNIMELLQSRLTPEDQARLNDQLARRADHIRLPITPIFADGPRPMILLLRMYYATGGQPVQAEVTLSDPVRPPMEDAAGLADMAALRTKLEACLQEADGGAVICLTTDLPSQEPVLMRRALGDRLRAFAAPDGLAAAENETTFYLVLPGPFDKLGLAQRLEDLHSLASSPITLAGVPQAWDPAAAIGAAAFTQQSAEPAALLRQARAEARAPGVHVYDPARDTRRPKAIQAALERLEGFSLDYQPIVTVETRQVLGFEATLRLTLPEIGLVSAGEIIPLAESSGQMVRLGRWIVENALSCVAELRRRDGQDYFVSVNLSAAQLDDPEFANHAYTALNACQLPGSALQLEISEARLLDAFIRQADILRKLRKLGVRVALDDYGAGSGALSHLYNMPVDSLKIDKGFLIGVAASPGREFILRTLIEVAHQLNLSVTAVGVEHHTRLSTLSKLGCDLAQGYHFCPPLPLDALKVWLDTRG